MMTSSGITHLNPNAVVLRTHEGGAAHWRSRIDRFDGKVWTIAIRSDSRDDDVII